MNISGVNSLDAAVGQLSSIKGNVTADQLSDLTSLFSTQFWNTSNPEEATATIERQIRDLEALLDDIQAEIDKVYEQQKNASEEMRGLVNDLNQESYQASKQADAMEKEQQDLVTSATDKAYNMYMKGEITKEEIPFQISKELAKGNAPGGAALESHLNAMDYKGQKITSISNKIAGILDSINEFKAKYQTTQTSLNLLQKLKAEVPKHKERPDIQQNVQKPVFTPSQEALGDKLIDKFKMERTVGVGDKSAATDALKDALGTGTVDDARKAELDAMSPEAKAAAVENCDLEKYSALELMYMSGMDVNQAGYAIGHIFRGCAIGYEAEEGAAQGKIVVPIGHDGVADVFRELESQYKTLWGGEVERGNMNENGDKGGADPIGWREGDTNFLFTIDRNGDGKFNGPEEFVGAENGWNEMIAADANSDGTLTAEEMATAGFSVMENNQALTGGGTYGWNGVVESGVGSIDLNSYKEMEAIKSENLNGNTRKAEFTMTVNGENVLGKQTENQEAYNDLFYSHTYNEAFTFGLDPEEVASALAEAAKPEDYMEAERFATETEAEKAQATIADSQNEIKASEENIAEIRASANNNTGANLNAPEEENAEEETATNTTDTTASTSTQQDTKVLEEE